MAGGANVGANTYRKISVPIAGTVIAIKSITISNTNAVLQSFDVTEDGYVDVTVRNLTGSNTQTNITVKALVRG